MIRVPRTRASSQRSVVPQGPPHHRAARGRVRPMTTAREPETEPARLAELVAALSLGIDLGFGQPMEHVLRQCLIALRLAEGMGLDEEQRASVYYTALSTTGPWSPPWVAFSLETFGISIASFVWVWRQARCGALAPHEAFDPSFGLVEPPGRYLSPAAAPPPSATARGGWRAGACAARPRRGPRPS